MQPSTNKNQHQATQQKDRTEVDQFIYKVYSGLLQIALFYGPGHQLEKVSEECLELHEAIQNYCADPSEQNRKAMLDEFADVLVVTGQFRKVLFTPEENKFVNQRMLFKIERQLKRMAKTRSVAFMRNQSNAFLESKRKSRKEDTPTQIPTIEATNPAWLSPTIEILTKTL